VRFVPALLALFYAGGIWYLSSRSFGGTPRGDWYWRAATNLVHFPLFGIFACLLAEALCLPVARRRRIALVMVLVASYGVVDEWHQSMTPGRSPEAWDVVVDVAGGFGLLMLWRHLRADLERRWALRLFWLAAIVALATLPLRQL